MRSAGRRSPLTLLVGACFACGASCTDEPRTMLDISFREPTDPTFLDGVDAFVFSVEDAGGQLLVLRRFAPAQAMRLDDVPFGRRLSFALDGLFMDTPIVAGRSCAVDIVAGEPLPHVSMFLGAVGAFSPTAASPAGFALAGSIALPRQDGRVLVAGGTTADGSVVDSAHSMTRAAACGRRITRCRVRGPARRGRPCRAGPWWSAAWVPMGRRSARSIATTR